MSRVLGMKSASTALPICGGTLTLALVTLGVNVAPPGAWPPRLPISFRGSLPSTISSTIWRQLASSAKQRIQMTAQLSRWSVFEPARLRLLRGFMTVSNPRRKARRSRGSVAPTCSECKGTHVSGSWQPRRIGEKDLHRLRRDQRDPAADRRPGHRRGHTSTSADLGFGDKGEGHGWRQSPWAPRRSSTRRQSPAATTKSPPRSCLVLRRLTAKRKPKRPAPTGWKSAPASSTNPRAQPGARRAVLQRRRSI
jgi:hypothetical protein